MLAARKVVCKNNVLILILFISCSPEGTNTRIVQFEHFLFLLSIVKAVHTLLLKYNFQKLYFGIIFQTSLHVNAHFHLFLFATYELHL